jgi:hypothetical protein
MRTYVNLLNAILMNIVKSSCNISRPHDPLLDGSGATSTKIPSKGTMGSAFEQDACLIDTNNRDYVRMDGSLGVCKCASQFQCSYLTFLDYLVL